MRVCLRQRRNNSLTRTEQLLAHTGASLGQSDRGKVPDRIHKLLSSFQRPVEALLLFLERRNKNFSGF